MVLQSRLLAAAHAGRGPRVTSGHVESFTLARSCGSSLDTSRTLNCPRGPSYWIAISLRMDEAKCFCCCSVGWELELPGLILGHTQKVCGG